MSELQKKLEYAKIVLLYSTASRGFWKKRVSELKKAIEEGEETDVKIPY